MCVRHPISRVDIKRMQQLNACVLTTCYMQPITVLTSWFNRYKCEVKIPLLLSTSAYYVHPQNGLTGHFYCLFICSLMLIFSFNNFFYFVDFFIFINENIHVIYHVWILYKIYDQSKWFSLYPFLHSCNYSIGICFMQKYLHQSTGYVDTLNITLKITALAFILMHI